MSIQIVAKRAGFRRCGIEHPGEPTIHADDKFTKAELKVLKSEPMLVVTEIREVKKDAGKGKDSKGKDNK